MNTLLRVRPRSPEFARTDGRLGAPPAEPEPAGGVDAAAAPAARAVGATPVEPLQPTTAP